MALFAAENADASRTKDDNEDEFKTSEFGLKWTGESRNDLLRAGTLAGSLGFYPARREL